MVGNQTLLCTHKSNLDLDKSLTEALVMDKPILIHAEHLIENAFGGPKHSLDTDNLGASGSRRRYLVFLPGVG